MYQRAVFAEHDPGQLDALFARDPFVTLVTTVDGAPFASHLPVLCTRQDEEILVEGHWARANPQAGHGGRALAIVHGPHAYVSPGWYPDKEHAARVPTWNYAVAHLQGALDIFDDEAGLADLVGRLSRRHEERIGSDWAFDGGRPELARQLRGIVGFRLRVDRVDMKFKLSQNHPRANVEAAAEGLRQLGGESNVGIAELMLARLAR